jgi:hypothetical protein
MLDREGIQRAIINRMDAMNGSCNSYHLNHNCGVLRGLLWALTGEDPGTFIVSEHNSNSVRDTLTAAGIPCRVEGERITWWYPWDDEPPAA